MMDPFAGRGQCLKRVYLTIVIVFPRSAGADRAVGRRYEMSGAPGVFFQV